MKFVAQLRRHSKSKIGHILLVQNSPSSRPTRPAQFFLLERSAKLLAIFMGNTRLEVGI